MITKNINGFRFVTTWPSRPPRRFGSAHPWTITMQADNQGGGVGFLDFTWVLKSGVNVDYQSSFFPFVWAVRLEQAMNPPFVDPVDGLFGGELFNFRARNVYDWSRA